MAAHASAWRLETPARLQAWLSLAKARYAMGAQTVCSARHRPHATASTQIRLVNGTSAPQLCAQCASADAQKAQLQSFGGLVSPHLQQAQQHFLKVVQQAAQCATHRQHLLACLPEDVSDAFVSSKCANAGMPGSDSHTQAQDAREDLGDGVDSALSEDESQQTSARGAGGVCAAQSCASPVGGVRKDQDISAQGNVTSF